MNNLLIEAFKKVCPAPLIPPAQRLYSKLYNQKTILRYKTKMVLYPQNMVRYCPCCGIKFQSFVAGLYREYPKRFNPSRYEHTRQDVLCPVCKSLPRHRILACWFERHLGYLRKANILFFAPGRSEMIWLKRNKVSCVTADLCAKADIQLDIQKTDLSDESYDLIVCNHVLEHVDDFRKALKEMYRILRPGGSFICSFPMDPKVELLDEDPSVQTEEERIRRFGQNDHKRVFGMKVDRFLKEVGFTVERIDGKDFPDEILPVVGPADYDINLLFRCIKPSSTPSFSS